MATISMFSDSYGFDITVDATTGAPTGVANVEKGVVQGMISGVTGMFNGGRSSSCGLAHTLEEVVKLWGYPTISNKMKGDTVVRLNPYSA